MLIYGLKEAIMPLCRRGLTDLDWFVMTGVELLEPDLDYLSKLSFISPMLDI